MAWRGQLPARHVAPYIGVQGLGALAGTAAVHAMHGLDLLAATPALRSGGGEWLGECVATFGLLCVFIGCGRSRPVVAPFAVSAYVMAACWFSSSAAFMNPAMTLARAVGAAGSLHLADVPVFVLAQLAGAAAATAIFLWLHGAPRGAVGLSGPRPPALHPAATAATAPSPPP